MHPYPNPGGEPDYEEEEDYSKVAARRHTRDPNTVVIEEYNSTGVSTSVTLITHRIMFADFVDDVKAGVYDNLCQPADTAESLLRDLVKYTGTITSRCWWCWRETGEHDPNCLWARAVYFVENTDEKE